MAGRPSESLCLGNLDLKRTPVHPVHLPHLPAQFIEERFEELLPAKCPENSSVLFSFQTSMTWSFAFIIEALSCSGFASQQAAAQSLSRVHLKELLTGPQCSPTMYPYSSCTPTFLSGIPFHLVHLRWPIATLLYLS